MFGQKLIIWYGINKRDLPWRETINPYLIWVSEVILQQTRVKQGLNYYHRFIEKYPDIFSLAQTNTEDLLKIWQGLGYYSRARNMLVAASDIVRLYHGVIPSSYEELITIKGIGDYTASAIASFAYKQAIPVIDGNVTRVISRLFGIDEAVDTTTGQKKIRKYAGEMLVNEIPDIYNQAIMEFGALQCVPKRPACNSCIFKTLCAAHKNNIVDIIPVKKPKPKLKTRYFHYLVINISEQIYLHKRTGDDIWNGLYEFPLIETENYVTSNNIIALKQWHSIFKDNVISLNYTSSEITHRLTHQILKIRFYEITIGQILEIPFFFRTSWVGIDQYAVPKVIENYIITKNNGLKSKE